MDRRIGGAGGGSDPGSGKAGKLVAATALAGAVAVAGGGLSGATGASGAATDGAAGSTSGQSLNAKKAEGKKSARKGDADQAWQRMGMRTLKRTAKQELQCLTHSFGQVREFFTRTPCKSLDRVLFAVGDGEGNAVVVSVVWVGFRTRNDAREFRRLEDVHGIGDIEPLSSKLLDLADIHFTGHHYQSRPDGLTTVVAEAETATGRISDEMLDAVADVAVLLPKR